MAAYAAVVSLINTITMEQIPHHTRHFNSAETKLIESLYEMATFLQEFLEGEWKGAKDLEGRIVDAAYAAEDAIESKIVDQVLSRSTSQAEKGSELLCQDLQKVIEDMDSIKIEAMQVKETAVSQHQVPERSTFTSSSRAPSIDKNIMVGFEDEKLRLMIELASQHSRRQVIPIVGMGGAGKTTLARNVYNDNFTVQYFDTCVWIIVSQEYNVKEILTEVLSSQRSQGMGKSLADIPNTISDNALGEQVHKSLSGRRYLIMLDDIWNIECWDNIRRFFPDNNNGSQIVVTTRLSNLANQISSCSLNMKFLDDNTSWTLFCEKVFAQERCPLELEEIGKKIVQNCKGLPLALVVIGGLLKKSSMTLEYWKQVAHDISSTISLKVDDFCLEILFSSYNHLPVHLKPCFLYMGVFREDYKIRVSELYNLWGAEGFLKPIRGKSSEEIAENFLNDLIGRNLILVEQWGSSGKLKSCKIHDLLRDLSLREAAKEKFLYVNGEPNFDVPLVMCSQHRIVFNQSIMENRESHQLFHSLQSISFTHSLVCNYDQELPTLTPLRLLRVLNVVDKYSYKPTTTEGKYPLEVVFQLVSSRYLAFRAEWKSNAIFPSIYQLRNIQILVVRGTVDPTIAPSEIWDMPQLRHIKFDTIVLPDPKFPQNDQQDYVVLKNLHTLANIDNFRCTKEILKKIPNIKSLRIDYRKSSMAYEEWHYYCLQNLDGFQKLESFSCFFLTYNPHRNVLIQNIIFPRSLKKLTLHGCKLLWEDMTMIGSIPHLEVLKLKVWSFKGPDWNPIEGEFSCLKFLLIDCCDDLINWNVDNSHFPRLEQLVLIQMTNLKEIPLDIGEISTLRSIQLRYCSNSAVISAKNILEEQESSGNVGLQIQVHLMDENESIKSLASENFHVQTCNIL